jgi:large subunit ribosomal protein L13
MQTFTIDANGKSIGRIASEAATLLMGKNRTDFTKNVKPLVHVKIEHAKGITLREKKLEQTMHERYSGYPGGLTYTSLKDLIQKKGIDEALRLSIYGMLPGNRLRAGMMKRIEITE